MEKEEYASNIAILSFAVLMIIIFILLISHQNQSYIPYNAQYNKSIILPVTKCSGLLYEKNQPSNHDLNITENQIINYCGEYGNNPDMISKCLVYYTDSFYKFKITPDSEKSNFTKLRDEGGDCKDWAEEFKSIVDNMQIDGIYTNVYVMQMTEYLQHEILIINNKHGFCIIASDKNGTKYTCII